MLPTCARLPSLETNLPSLPSILVPYIGSKDVFRCVADRTMFQQEATSYEWNSFLNGAPYDRPEDWTPVTQGLVEVIFGGRVNTPLAGDAEPFHVPGGDYLGKNALFFDGRVEGARVKW
jgi:prepilin-type processing-associated H-X9-DG protein